MSKTFMEAFEKSEKNLAFMRAVANTPMVEYALFELTLMQESVLAAILELPMQRAQELLWKENINKLTTFLKQARPLMDQAIADQIVADFERKDYRVALMRLFKYIKDTRYAVESLSQ